MGQTRLIELILMQVLTHRHSNRFKNYTNVSIYLQKIKVKHT